MRNIYADTGDVVPVQAMDVDVRAQFITRTYMHLFGAIAAFTAIEIGLFYTGVAEAIAAPMMSSWFLVLGAFILVSAVFTRMAHRALTLPMQYLALAGFVLLESLIFAPMLWIAQAYSPPGVISIAAGVTLIGFLILTVVAFWTRKDFSFLGGMLKFVGIGALCLIGAQLVFGFELGNWFSIAMIGLAGGTILYQTSGVMKHYPEDRYVAASLDLFASVAMLFWYVLRIFMSRD